MPSEILKRVGVPGRGRHYKLPSGEVVPSVTNVLSVSPKPGLIPWAAVRERTKCIEAARVLNTEGHLEGAKYLLELVKRIGEKRRHEELLDEAAAFGFELHAWIEYHIRGGEKNSRQKIPPVTVTGHAISNWLRWWEAAGILPLYMEKRVHSLELGVAGTLDMAGIQKVDGRNIIFDWKSSNALRLEALIQTAVYMQCVFECKLIPDLDGAHYLHGAVVRVPKQADQDVEIECIDSKEKLDGLLETFRALKLVWERFA